MTSYTAILHGDRPKRQFEWTDVIEVPYDVEAMSTLLRKGGAIGGLALQITLSVSSPLSAANVAGKVTDRDGNPVDGARVTLFTPDLGSFFEARSDASGRY